MRHLSATEEFALYHPEISVWDEGAERQDDVHAVSESDSSSSYSSSGRGSSSEDEERSHAFLATVNETGITRAPSEQCDTMRVFRHSRTRMFHYSHVTSSDKTGCGRWLSEAYYVFSAPTDLVYPKCKHCFGHYVRNDPPSAPSSIRWRSPLVSPEASSKVPH